MVSAALARFPDLVTDPETSSAELSERVLVLAPTGSDAGQTVQFLQAAGMDGWVCAGMPDLAHEIARGCGAILVAEESLGETAVRTLAEALNRQPPWSDVPVTLVTSNDEVAHEALRRLGLFVEAANVTLLERPFHRRTLIHMLDVALRARRRQYQIRDLLAQSREDARHLEFVLSAGGLGAWKLDWATNELTWSESCKAHFGLPPEAETTLELFSQLVHPDDREHVQREIRYAVQRRSDFHVEYRVVVNGATRWIMARGRNAYAADGRPAHFSGVTLDVTQRRQAEESLRTVSQRFRLLAEAVPEKIFSCAALGVTDYCNRRLHDYSGVKEPQQWKWSSFVHPDDVGETERRWNHTLATGEPFQIEHRIRDAEGTYRWHLSRAHALRGNNGSGTACIGCCTDIEDRKQQEERLEQTVAARTAALRETIQELEAFSYSISHDMRQPLRAMEGYAQALVEDHGTKLDGDARHYLDRIRSSAVRLDKLIQDVLDYSRVSRGNLELTTIDLDRLVHDVVDTYPTLRGAAISIQSPLGRVRGHEVPLTQCVSNLLGNATKFAAESRPLRVKVWTEQREGGWLRLWIEDNGIGIKRRDHQRIFDMFAQVHGERYGGTGIGLTITRKAVARMNGHLGLVSTFGRGSRFWIELPSVQA